MARTNFKVNFTFRLLLVCLVRELSALLEDHCTDVSYYSAVEYTTNTKQCCKPELKEYCEYKRQDICKDVLEVQCQPKARVECRSENSFVSGKKCEVELKNYDYKNCDKKKVSTRIECKQSAVNSCKPKLKVYEDGHAKFNGEVSCTPLFYEDCVVVDTADCTCSEFTNNNGVGKCRGRIELGGSVVFEGQVACYVNLPSSCEDMVESETNPGKYLSAEACNCENVDTNNTVPMEACGQVPLGRHGPRYNQLEDFQIYGQASSSSLHTCTTPFQVKWADFTEKEKPMMKQETVCEVKSSVECQRVSVTKCTYVDYKECSWRPVQQCEPVSVSEPTQEKIHRKKCLNTETEDLNISCGFDDEKHLSVEDESISGLSLVLQTDWFTWDNGKVPYYFKGSVTVGDRKLILGVMEEIEQHTCFKYIPHDTEPVGHHLEIEINPRSCETFSAYVDNRPENRDKVIFYSHFQLTDCARQLDTRLGVLHELMHTFGVMHTQKRRDRDQVITVQWENILAKAKDQYRICDKCEIFPGIGYDCDSIMHYGYQTFSRNKFVKTMESNDDSKCKLSRNGPAFAADAKPSPSDWDVLQILGGLVCDKRQSYDRKGRTRVYIDPEEDEEILESSYPLKVMDRDSGFTLATVDQVREHMVPLLKDLEKVCGPWCVARIEGARVRGPGFSRNIVPINPTQEEQLEIVTIPEF